MVYRFGADLTGNRREFISRILVATTGPGTIIAIEAFRGSLTQLECVRRSWLYQIIGGKAPERPPGYRVPAFQCPPSSCRLQRLCWVPAVFDSNVDRDKELLFGTVNEPHFLSPIPPYTTGEGETLGSRAKRVNKRIESARKPVEGTIGLLWSAFPILLDPVTTFGKFSEHYNQLLEALSAWHNNAIVEGKFGVPDYFTFFEGPITAVHPLRHLAYCTIAEGGPTDYQQRFVPPAVDLRALDFTEMFMKDDTVVFEEGVAEEIIE